MPRSGGSYIIKDGERIPVSRTKPAGSPLEAKDVPNISTDKSSKPKAPGKSDLKAE